MLCSAVQCCAASNVCKTKNTFHTIFWEKKVRIQIFVFLINCSSQAPSCKRTRIEIHFVVVILVILVFIKNSGSKLIDYTYRSPEPKLWKSWLNIFELRKSHYLSWKKFQFSNTNSIWNLGILLSRCFKHHWQNLKKSHNDQV